MTTLVWFRQDLRIDDNPALAAAAAAAGSVVPVYVHAPGEEGAWQPGAASRWWLHHSLARLDADLAARGSRLILRVAEDSLQALLDLARESGATRVVWNRRYEPASIARDKRVKAAVRAAGLASASYNASLLHEPWTIATKTGGPFQVFTPFWRHVKALPDPPQPLAAPDRIEPPARWPGSVDLTSVDLLPRPDWAQGLRAHWQPGSAAAQTRLDQFLSADFAKYGEQRNQPSVPGTSRLSPHLHFGEIGPRQIWHATRSFAAAAGGSSQWRDSQFLAEVGWREFAHHLLYHFPHTPQEPLRAQYGRFPWKHDPAALERWARGLTGYPLVDAGLRELWHTGWMHNRVRMIAGSFLIKDLLIDWTHGARHFWDTLVDADLASNTLGWQWVAGSGADAAPFFRIFNPTGQAAKFDPDGLYIRRWVPELAPLPNVWIHQPWAAPPEVMTAAGIRLGEQYPHPMVDHDEARRRALAALAQIKI